MTNEGKKVEEELGPDGLPGHDYFLDAVNHIDEAVASNSIAAGTRRRSHRLPRQGSGSIC